MRRRLRPRQLVAVALVATVLAGCGGSDGGHTPDRTPTQELTAARRTLDTTSGVQIALTTEDLPSGVTGITSAEGVGTHPASGQSAFEGTFSISYQGLPTQAEVVAVDGTTYARNAILLPDWTPIDPADYGAPDPTTLMKPDGGLSGLLSAITGLTQGKTVRGGADNSEILTSYAGTVPAAAVAALVPSATGDFAVSYRVTDDDQLRAAVITGDFYDTGDRVTYDLVLSGYGTEKDIVAPTS